MLTCNNQRLWVQILSPQRAVFSVLDAAPLPSSPNPQGQTSNAGVKKLAIHLKEVSEETIAVWMVPLQPGEAMPGTAPEAVPLARWEELM